MHPPSQNQLPRLDLSPQRVYVQLYSLMDSNDKLAEIEGSLKERLGKMWSASHQEASNTMLGFRRDDGAAPAEGEQTAMKICCVKMLQRTEHCLEELNKLLAHRECLDRLESAAWYREGANPRHCLTPLAEPAHTADRPRHVLVIIRRGSTHEDPERILSAQRYPRVANTFKRAFFLVQDPHSRSLNEDSSVNVNTLRELCNIVRAGT